MEVIGLKNKKHDIILITLIIPKIFEAVFSINFFILFFSIFDHFHEGLVI